MEMECPPERMELDPNAPNGGCFEILKDYETRDGVEVLLNTLTQGRVRIRALHSDGWDLTLSILLRCPEDSEDQVSMFKDMIVNWVKEDRLTFCERFFRLPKFSEDISDRYLDNPLEHMLRKKFGFHFSYKLLVFSMGHEAESTEIRGGLHRVLAYS